MIPAHEYAKIISALTKPLPAYVRYVAKSEVWGIDTSTRVTTHFVNGKATPPVRQGHGPFKHTSDSTNLNSAFVPACYRVVGERIGSWRGKPAVVFSLAPICSPKWNSGFPILYADPHTMRPLFVTVTMGKGQAKATLSEMFGEFNGYILPTVVKTVLQGRGSASWLQVTMTMLYSRYEFSATPFMTK
uniref:Uncharacterized protein n=1 Tax=mine drainage metagenome TaxID=410659 RepID=E6PH35_9ZZZZ